VNEQLLTILRQHAQAALETNTRFHDFGHALEVLHYVQKIHTAEGGDIYVLTAAAFFHDVGNSSDPELEGIDSAKIAAIKLDEISSFPKEKIKQVCSLIESLNRQAQTLDEIILNDADSLAMFSDLSVCRGFMISGKKNMQVKEAILDFEGLIDHKIQSFRDAYKPHTATARKIADETYPNIKKFFQKCLAVYNY
jgi:HD superfamily phosphodiesterase